MPPCRAAKGANGSKRQQSLPPRARSLIDAGDILLVKGSKGSKVSLSLTPLRKIGQAAAPKEGTT
jgi:UDP-N-acetylmuramoyl-tripeptide--D-alanyl-D-alanine ligase